MAEFGIQIKLETAAAEAGAKKVDTALGGIETKAKETGKKVGDSLGKGFDEAAREAMKALKQMAQEEKEWAAAAIKAKRDVAAAAAAAAKVQAQAAAQAALAVADARKLEAEAMAKVKVSIEAYDSALKRSVVSAMEQDKTLRRVMNGWKEVTRAVGDVGNAINGVKVGIELVSKAFEVSKVAAVAAIAAWRSMDNSGPSAYVGGASRRGKRVDKLNAELAENAIGEEYTADNAPAGIRRFIEETHLSEAEFEVAIDDYIKVIRDGRKKLDKEMADFKADPRNSSNTPFDYAAAAKADAAKAKAARDAARKAAGSGRSSGGGMVAADEWTWGVQAFNDYVTGMQAFQDQAIADAESFAEGLAGAYYDASNAVAEFFDGGQASGGMSFKEKLESGQNLVEKQADEWQNLADVLEGPLAGAFDGFLDRMGEMVKAWDFSAASMREWGRDFAIEIAKAIVRALILRAIISSFGAGGGSGWFGQLLNGIAGGTPAPGGAARLAPGDPFGGGAGGSAPIVTERVAPSQQSAGGAGGGQQAINVKVVNNFDMNRALLDMLDTPEGTRAILNVVSSNGGKLGLGGR